MAERVRPTTWEELDNLLTAAGEVDNMIECIWMAAESKGGCTSNATGAIQTVASAAQLRLCTIRQSLEAFMHEARS